MGAYINTLREEGTKEEILEQLEIKMDEIEKLKAEIERLRGEIKRLREPTDEMLEAGADMDCKAHTENRSGAGDWSSEQVAEAVYRAMIDKVESE